VVQNGSLPVYLGVIALTLVASVAVPLTRAAAVPDELVPADGWVQVAVVVIMLVATVGCALVGRRMTAVVLVGTVGYGMAALFVVQGAPDLAVTQLLVETLTVVAFVLVLRHLPERFPPPALPATRLLRAGVALAVGVVVFGFTLGSVAQRSAPPVSDEYVARSLPEGGGRNVVNVILVDFRALDTLGEISVLVAAALGVAALVRAGRRPAGPASTRPAEPATSQPTEPGVAPPPTTAGRVGR
jgi:multicomponent Na+:H+ antiporter subunit A